MWIKVSNYGPPEQEVVWTKIDDIKVGERNVQKLKRIKNLWWFEDGSMYITLLLTGSIKGII